MILPQLQRSYLLGLAGAFEQKLTVSTKSGHAKLL